MRSGPRGRNRGHAHGFSRGRWFLAPDFPFAKRVCADKMRACARISQAHHGSPAMATVSEQRRRLFEYPTSDGKPMAETEFHRKLMTALIETLEAWFAR